MTETARRLRKSDDFPPFDHSTPPQPRHEQHLTNKSTTMGWYLSYGFQSYWFTVVPIWLQMNFQEPENTMGRHGQKEWHIWRCGGWIREADTSLASVNVIIMMRWWDNPAVFLCCLFVHMNVCVFNHTPAFYAAAASELFGEFICGYCVWTEWSLYSRLVVYSLLGDSLLPACVVYLCSLWEVWLTPHSWPNQTWLDLTGSDHTSINTPEQAWSFIISGAEAT